MLIDYVTLTVNSLAPCMPSYGFKLLISYNHVYRNAKSDEPNRYITVCQMDNGSSTPTSVVIPATVSTGRFPKCEHDSLCFGIR